MRRSSSARLRALALALPRVPLLHAAFLVLLLSLTGRVASAEEVDVCLSGEADALTSETVVRIRAELRVAGLSVAPQACSSESISLGRIELRLLDDGIEVTAASVRSRALMRQLIDPERPGVTAEVIAVRAVESLRAVILQSLRSGELGEAQLSDRARSFTADSPASTAQQTPPAATPEASAEQPRSTRPRAAGRRRYSTARGGGSDADSPLGLLFAAGPSAELHPGIPTALAGGELRATLRFDSVSVGAFTSFALPLGTVELGQKRIRATGWRIALRPALQLGCEGKWDCELAGLFGLSRYRLVVQSPVADQETIRHPSLSLEGELYFGRRLLGGWGIGAFLHGGVLLDAPTLRSPSLGEQRTWGRPTTGLSLSLIYLWDSSSSR